MFTPIQNRDKSGLTFSALPNTTGITLYNGTGAAIVKGDVMVISYSTDADEIAAGKYMQCKAAATNAILIERVVIALEAIPIAKMGFFAVEGFVEECNCLNSAAFTAGQSLKCVTAKDYLILDHATPTNKQAAIAMEAYAGTTSVELVKAVWLLSKPHAI